jgi:hypothetical protein
MEQLQKHVLMSTVMCRSVCAQRLKMVLQAFADSLPPTKKFRFSDCYDRKTIYFDFEETLFRAKVTLMPGYSGFGKMQCLEIKIRNDGYFHSTGDTASTQEEMMDFIRDLCGTSIGKMVEGGFSLDEANYGCVPPHYVKFYLWDKTARPHRVIVLHFVDGEAEPAFIKHIFTE